MTIFQYQMTSKRGLSNNQGIGFVFFAREFCRGFWDEGPQILLGGSNSSSHLQPWTNLEQTVEVLM